MLIYLQMIESEADKSKFEMTAFSITKTSWNMKLYFLEFFQAF